MGSTIQLALDDTPVTTDFYNTVELLEVEENADRPDALVMRVPVNRTSGGDLQYVGDGTLEPYTNITLTVTPPSQPTQCIFDGYVLGWKLHLDRTGSCSTLEVWAQDASWLMNVSDTVQEWPGMTDGQVANAIFDSYGFTPDPSNDDPELPIHDPDLHSLFQRATDLQFLRGLARRDGKLCRVACTDMPGDRTGYFITPDLSGDPVTTITLSDPEAWSVDSLDFELGRDAPERGRRQPAGCPIIRRRDRRRCHRQRPGAAQHERHSDAGLPYACKRATHSGGRLGNAAADPDRGRARGAAPRDGRASRRGLVHALHG